ncbi:zinc ion binding [Puccinia graminis f. sp. tritici]|uniref:Zinc ion binding n=1 Tax=Puccinia graminis f. sp. tritici TaxID=56615 RepID=A0A5B0S467_PUCGR|nr:zinc ion binding [Puccinia graminis f. sp. tritici]
MTDAALAPLGPEDRDLFKLFIASLQEAYGELYRDPLRTRFNAEEQAHNSRFVDQVDDLLERLERKVAGPLFDVWLYWIRVIDELEESRVLSRRKRRILVEERLDTLSDTTPAALPSNPDGESSDCTVCIDELSNPEKSLIQLPCHPSHLFHRDCIQKWLEGHLGCPICRVEVELPPWEYPC